MGRVKTVKRKRGLEGKQSVLDSKAEEFTLKEQKA